MADDSMVSDGALEPIASRSRSVWQAPLAILDSLSRSPGDLPNSAHRRGKREEKAIHGNTANGATLSSCSTAISVVERFNSEFVAISWRDPLQGCYSEQQWRRRICRSAGTCSLSGAEITRGAVVYMPARKAFHKPCNAGAMILATALEEAFTLQQTNS
jgi:Domain of unknown function (DUF3331)